MPRAVPDDPKASLPEETKRLIDLIIDLAVAAWVRGEGVK
jgi:hypothetical protein